ncbi:MAG: ABC transporter substrate-binding protein [Cyanobacteriota bacterium]|nr:ABC transporter substrate-binding protein [Cyanobacteriota bacterium]
MIRFGEMNRRRFLQWGALTVGGSAILSRQASHAQSDANPTIKIGFWPIAAGLPLYMGVEKGIFKDAGLNVEAVKFASAQQVAEGIIAGRLQGSANGTASGALGLAEIASPGLFKIIATNPSNVDHVLDQFLVAKDSPIQSIAELKDKKVACGPGAQNIAIAKGILKANGIVDPNVQALDIKQHVPAIQSGQIDAVYTLEPTGTVGGLAGITRILEAGVVAKYILGDPKAPWSGGSATLTNEFLKQYPEVSKTYIAAYRQSIEEIRKDPDAARPFLEGYTAITGDLTKTVPLPAYLIYDEFTDRDKQYFQKFFDFMTSEGIFSKNVPIEPLLYQEAG